MSRPLALNELKKLGAPRTLGHTILLPVQNKFRHQLLGELTIDIGHLQYIVDRGLGLPLGFNFPRHAVLIHHPGKELPLATNMLDKLRVPGAGDITAVAPVENKLGNRIFNKVAIDTTLTNQDLQRISRGSPLIGQCHFLTTAMGGGFSLLPLTPNLFNKFRLPAVARHIALPPIGDKLGNLLLSKGLSHTQLAQLPHGILTRLPAIAHSLG